MQTFSEALAAADPADQEALSATLSSRILLGGPQAEEFERALCEYTGAPCAVTASSVGAAFSLLLDTLGLRAPERLLIAAICPPTLLAPATLRGIGIDLLDVDPLSGLATPALLRKRLLGMREQGQSLPRAIVAMGLSGQPLDTPGLGSVAHEFGALLIEDASESLGSGANGQGPGGEGADFTVLGFRPGAPLTTGDGGALLLHDAALADDLRARRGLGPQDDPDECATFSKEGTDDLCAVPGLDCRMGELQAALGLSRLERLPQMLAERREAALRYQELLGGCGLLLPAPDTPGRKSAWVRYPIGIRGDLSAQVLPLLRNKGVVATKRYPPLYRHRLPGLGAQGPLEGCEIFYRHTLSLPIFVGLKPLDQQFIAADLLHALDTLK
ncbi:MAG: DegT/DnrJ/EryC1/StrS aminotransferase family protein [Succinivibrionaceae bacterium]|nr:DegT/DnrJ/EryC1/StrS aminotransferase family protein [Succinivibrionaceae bacterium]